MRPPITSRMPSTLFKIELLEENRIFFGRKWKCKLKIKISAGNRNVGRKSNIFWSKIEM